LAILEVDLDQAPPPIAFEQDAGTEKPQDKRDDPRAANMDRLLDWLQKCDIDNLEEAELDAALEALGVDTSAILDVPSDYENQPEEVELDAASDFPAAGAVGGSVVPLSRTRPKRAAFDLAWRLACVVAVTALAASVCLVTFNRNASLRHEVMAPQKEINEVKGLDSEGNRTLAEGHDESLSNKHQTVPFPDVLQRIASMYAKRPDHSTVEGQDGLSLPKSVLASAPLPNAQGVPTTNLDSSLLQITFSDLGQINTGNVKNLIPAWTFATGAESARVGPPIVKNDVMFIATAHGQVLALNAATGNLLWRYNGKLPQGFSAPHNVSGGLALYGDKVYFTSPDVRVVALDAKTGTVAWEAKVEDWKTTDVTMAPLIAKDKVLVGVSGGEFGVRGFITAFDAETGKPIWKTYTISAPAEPSSWKSYSVSAAGEPSSEMREKPVNWMTGNYNADTNTIYWDTGNASLWSGEQRPGDDLYTSLTVALDGDTGKIKKYVQYRQNEPRDSGAMNASTVANFREDGLSTKGPPLTPQRNGYLYWLERNSNGSISYLDSEGDVPQEAFKSIDPKTGRLSADLAHKPGSGKAAKFCPDLRGDKGWLFNAYNPKDIRIYYDSRCGFIAGESQEDVAGQPWNGALLTTAGGLVFSGGTNDPYFRAYDAQTGNQLWQFRTNSGISAPPSTFEVGGAQYVAVRSGNGVDSAHQELLLSELLPGWNGDIPQGGVIWVFAVPK
jgi:alcohol dehydrogenase (cytochrome c)